MDTLLIPPWVAAISATVLLGRLFSRDQRPQQLETFRSEDIQQSCPWNVVKAQASVHGGMKIFLFKVARLFGLLALFALSMVTLITGMKYNEEDLVKWTLSAWKGRAHTLLTEIEWIQLAVSLTYLYASLLAVIDIAMKPSFRKIQSVLEWTSHAPTHLTLLLLVTFTIYATRDLYPLATFTLTPIDLVYDSPAFLYSKLSILCLTSIILPLTMPRSHTPYGLGHSARKSSPEEACSILSFALYSFLDPVIFLGHRVPRISHDQLPPLADEDFAASLRTVAFPHVDAFFGNDRTAKKRQRHIFWDLMHIFRKEYAVLVIMIIIHIVFGFSAPLCINRILSYLETGGHDAVIRPWFWVICLLVGPSLASIALQWYTFIATRTLVRVESIITQLVFSHSLRIRLRAENSSPSVPLSTPATVTSFEPAEATIQDDRNDHREEDSRSCSSVTVASLPLSATSEPADEFVDTGNVGHPGNETDMDNRHAEEMSTRWPHLLTRAKSMIRFRLPSSSTSAPARSKSKPMASSSLTSPSQTTLGPDTEASRPKPASSLVGKINNLVTTDLGNIGDGVNFIMVLVYIPLQIILCVVFLWAVLGWSAFAGLVTMLLLLPLPGYVGKLVQNVQRRTMERTDARVQSVTEALNALRTIKLFGWERKMIDTVTEKREDELTWLWKKQVLDWINWNFNYLIPVATMVTLIMKEELSASKVFSSMAVFDMLREQLDMIILYVTSTIQAKVSFDRVDEFLRETELLDAFTQQNGSTELHGPTPECDQADGDTDSSLSRCSSSSSLSRLPYIDSNTCIGFRDAYFSWSTEEYCRDIGGGSNISLCHDFVLRIEGDLLFKRGGINLIVGPTGSGKTSLLLALLGEMHFMPSGASSWFNLPQQGGVSYAAQESWVQNETIRDNIVFSAPFDQDRYKKVIHQCCLERDLELFEAGDMTEVGEKGLALSGGQKARITLARAIYSRAEIVLLDDVFAALDVHTAKWIVNKCLTGDLVKNRTVILATHNVALTSPIADFVVSLGLNGKVVSQGTMSDAVAKDRLLAHETDEDRKALNSADDNIIKPSSDHEPERPKGKLVVEEEVEVGYVGWAAVKMYVSALGGTRPMLFSVVFVFGLLFAEICTAVQTWFLGFWASQYQTRPASEVSVPYYLSIYGLVLLSAIFIHTLSFANFFFGRLRASRGIHNQLIRSVLGATLRWLDTTPTSRIIARCTQDIRAVDGPVGQWLSIIASITSSMLVKLGAVVVLTPLFLGPGLVAALLGGWCSQVYMAVQLSVKRELSNAKSPVVGHFGAAISGLTSIRAYGAQEAFEQQLLRRIDHYTRAARTFHNLNRWISIRIDGLGNILTAGLAAYLVYGKGQSAANTGFSLNMAVAFSSMILWWVKGLNEFEVQGNSLERIQGYTHVEQEPKPSETGKPPAYWPASGDILVENLSARYAPDGPKVLNNISFHIKSGERIGVVGRTGSGKSSLTLALLRCIYLDGAIYYDGLRTSSVNLDALRSSITIIPQVPELLSGTLRENLDPFSQFDDATLNQALRSAGLYSLQRDGDDNRITLDTPISGGGTNLSIGQRQILALARAIVRQSKLLILDEATSAIDHQTDAIIQSSLRRELGRDTTLITVAHRLQTVMDADKIMVLDAGQIVEFGAPKQLIKIKDGRLRALVEESEDRASLMAMASQQVT